MSASVVVMIAYAVLGLSMAGDGYGDGEGVPGGAVMAGAAGGAYGERAAGAVCCNG